jgi:hypothetical protein
LRRFAGQAAGKWARHGAMVDQELALSIRLKQTVGFDAISFDFG